MFEKPKNKEKIDGVMNGYGKEDLENLENMARLRVSFYGKW
jgi:hypothetical protein